MNCLFDQCELINGLFLGIFASLIASLIVIFFINSKNKKTKKKKFGKAIGKYKGYGYSISNPDLILKDKPQSEATITYIKENILEIELTEFPYKGMYKWKGIITMELEYYGSLAWNYELYEGKELKNNKHKFGFKRLIIREDENYVYIYLADENLVGGEVYSKEILIKEKIKA